MGKVEKIRKVGEVRKQFSLEICASLNLRHKNDPLLHRILTYDEKWILYINRKRSGQWLDAE